jgi:PKD repeat protein
MRTKPHLNRPTLSLMACAVLCLGLTGCLLPASNRAPVIVVEALPREGYAPLNVAFDASRSFDPEGQALTIEWDFADGERAVGPNVSHSFRVAGQYDVLLSAADPEGVVTTEAVRIEVRVVPEGYTLRRFAWERDAVPRTWDVLIPYDLYQMYKGRLRHPYVDNYAYGDYVLDPLDDPTLEDYAIALWNRVGQDHDEFLHEALAFVQGAIRYRADPPGVEHPLYPLETLADGVGDCEDTAILFVSLLRAMDIPCKLAFVDTNSDGTPDHVLAFVAIPDSMVPTLRCAGAVTTFAWEGRTFAVAETAVDQGIYALGCDPWGLDEGDLAKLWSFPDP